MARRMQGACRRCRGLVVPSVVPTEEGSVVRYARCMNCGAASRGVLVTGYRGYRPDGQPVGATRGRAARRPRPVTRRQRADLWGKRRVKGPRDVGPRDAGPR